MEIGFQDITRDEEAALYQLLGLLESPVLVLDAHHVVIAHGI
jgi:hypothetical protein